MRPKFYQLDDTQVEQLKDLLSSTVEECEGDQEPDEEYMDSLTAIYGTLVLGAPDMDALAVEIHQLKNQLQALQIESAMLKKDS